MFARRVIAADASGPDFSSGGVDRGRPGSARETSRGGAFGPLERYKVQLRSRGTAAENRSRACSDDAAWLLLLTPAPRGERVGKKHVLQVIRLPSSRAGRSSAPRATPHAQLRVAVARGMREVHGRRVARAVRSDTDGQSRQSVRAHSPAACAAVAGDCPSGGVQATTSVTTRSATATSAATPPARGAIISPP